ncbi:tripartite motif-containing protein 16-like protein isoform X2 [Dunckerocampus dactyliophorus]|uniref:tripartite motif-containing protein 16-like protein isoform X2 n=1 Tax=Dunckerocampus dactyliophorus TaxID=161453 RepID=UPI00240583F9|nr:tripartite motif-containing protein 16-like protein isoform X2 [Dunckerocampus dactyliophorus]
MAAATISVEQDQFSCSVCLEVLRDPVTIPCGHSYCLGCIEDYWNRTKQKGQYSCPQCRQVFSPKPQLNRNTVLGELVEKLVQSGLQEPAGPPVSTEEVKCGVCTGKKSNAVTSCVTCTESYCAAHLRAHDERFRGRGHSLVPAAVGQTTTKRSKEKLCPYHHKVVRSYCRVDHEGACSRCVKSQHKGHEVVQLVDERTEQQHATEAAVEESERIFSKLIRTIEKHRSDVKEMIRGRERVALTQAEQLLEKVEREMTELRRGEAELEKLSRMDDHLHFLQKCRSLHFPSKRVQTPNTDTFPYLMYKSIRGGLAELRDSLDESLQREFNRISDKVFSLKETSNPNPSEKTKVTLDSHILYDSEPKTREEFLHYTQDLTLDLNTANPYLSLSEGHRAVTTRSEPQPYPEHPDRFTSWAQVLCRAGMAGRCYWEVEWAGKGGASVGVCYRSMSRSGGGSDSKLGHNSKSWSLDCTHGGCMFRHDKHSVSLAIPCGNRIGVYLNFRGGVLSFYNVSDSMVHLHSVQTTFSQPVYPGFWVGLGSTLKLCSL